MKNDMCFFEMPNSNTTIFEKLQLQRQYISLYIKKVYQSIKVSSQLYFCIISPIFLLQNETMVCPLSIFASYLNSTTTLCKQYFFANALKIYFNLVQNLIKTEPSPIIMHASELKNNWDCSRRRENQVAQGRWRIATAADCGELGTWSQTRGCGAARCAQRRRA